MQLIPALGKTWGDMAEGEREAWEVLGWVEELWTEYEVEDETDAFLHAGCTYT
jgi:hypothetical protein